MKKKEKGKLRRMVAIGQKLYRDKLRSDKRDIARNNLASQNAYRLAIGLDARNEN